MKVRRRKNEISEQCKICISYRDKWGKIENFTDDRGNDVVLVLSEFHVDRTLEDNWSYPYKSEICLLEEKQNIKKKQLKLRGFAEINLSQLNIYKTKWY